MNTGSKLLYFAEEPVFQWGEWTFPGLAGPCVSFHETRSLVDLHVEVISDIGSNP